MLLEGTAVQGLTLTEANYDSVVEILQERFGRPPQIISAHMDKLIKLQPSHNDRPASLRYIYDRISVHVRSLALLGISTEQYGKLFETWTCCQHLQKSEGLPPLWRIHHQSICPSLSNPCSDGRPTTSSPEQKSAIQPQPTQLETREQFFYKQKKLCPSMQTT